MTSGEFGDICQSAMLFGVGSFNVLFGNMFSTVFFRRISKFNYFKGENTASHRVSKMFLYACIARIP